MRKITTLRSMSYRERSGVVLSREEKSEIVTPFMSKKGCCKEKGDKLTPVSTVEEGIQITRRKICLILWLRKQ